MYINNPERYKGFLPQQILNVQSPQQILISKDPKPRKELLCEMHQNSLVQNAIRFSYKNKINKICSTENQNKLNELL